MNYKYEDKLESLRFRTRFLAKEDIQIWKHFFDDLDAVKYFPTFGFETSKERAQHWIEKQLLRYKDRRFGLQALISKENGEFIGQCGLLLQEVEGVEEVEVGYHVFQKHWGKGLAPEAAKLFMSYAFKNNIADNLISLIDIRNIQSQKVAEKNGLTKETQVEWNGMDVFVYRITKDQFESKEI